jgi:hypothetical protein
MKRNIKGIPVDSGLIMICDKDHYKKYNYKRNVLLVHEIDVPKGSYKIDWHIPDSHNGDIRGNNILKVTTGKIIVGDPCYSIDDKKNNKTVEKAWDSWLKDTNYGMNPPKGCVVISEMGGDGKFDIHLELRGD